MSFDNGMRAQYSYDVMDRMTHIAWRDAESNVLRSFTYGYDAAGMITQKQVGASGSVRTEAYTCYSPYPNTSGWVYTPNSVADDVGGRNERRLRNLRLKKALGL